MSIARTIRAGFSKVDITPPLDRMEVFGLGYWFELAVRFAVYAIHYLCEHSRWATMPSAS